MVAFFKTVCPLGALHGKLTLALKAANLLRSGCHGRRCCGGGGGGGRLRVKRCVWPPSHKQHECMHGVIEAQVAPFMRRTVHVWVEWCLDTDESFAGRHPPSTCCGSCCGCGARLPGSMEQLEGSSRGGAVASSAPGTHGCTAQKGGGAGGRAREGHLQFATAWRCQCRRPF